MQDTAHRCVRAVDPTECVPGGALSVSLLTTSIHLAAHPTALPSITPALQTARRTDGTTVAATATGGLPEPLLDAASGTCFNVALGVAYTVITRSGDALVEDPGGQIAEVRVDVVLGDAAVATSDGRLLVQQAYSATFRNIASAVRPVPCRPPAPTMCAGTRCHGHTSPLPRCQARAHVGSGAARRVQVSWARACSRFEVLPMPRTGCTEEGQD